MRRHLGTLTWAAIMAVTLLVGRPHAAFALDHCGQITSNETWTAADRPHVVTCDVTVRNSTLTLEPGTIVQLAEGANLVIGSGASLQAVGIREATIRIAGAVRNQQPGFWGQIRFEPTSRESFFDYVEVIGGGRDGVPMIEVLGPGAQLFRMALRQTGGAPLAIAADAVGPSLALVLDVTVGRCNAVETSQLGRAEILVRADAAVDVTQEATWPSICLPYRVDEPLVVAGPDLPTLGLDVGVTVTFGSGAGIVTGVDDANRGQLTTSGSIEEPVVLTGVDKTPGSWSGVVLTAFGDGSFLANTQIEYGGAGMAPMLVVSDTLASAVDLRLRHAAGYPVALPSTAVSAFFIGLDEGKVAAPVIAQNGIDRVLVRAAAIAVDVPSSARWAGIGVPYDVDGDLLVAGVRAPATLTLEAGARLAFAPGAGLIVGDATVGQASLVASGASSRRIVLTGQSESPGAWRGVVVTDAALEATIDKVDVSYGGADGPMVRWGDVPGSVVRARFSHAAGYPLALPVQRLAVLMGDAQVEASNRNAFADNGTDRILATGAAQFAPRQATWGDPGAPVEFEGDLTIASPLRPVVTWQGGLRLMFRAGHGLRVGVSDAERGAVVVGASRAGEAIVLGAVDPEAGWAGARVDQGSDLFDEDGAPGLVLRDAAANAALLTVVGGDVILRGTELLGRDGRGDGLSVGAGGTVTLSGPRITGHRVGARARDGGRYILEKGWVTGNAEYGALNEDPDTCQTASVIWWGDAAGPSDASDAADGCMDAANESAGDAVSDDVDWASYAIDEELTPVGGIVGGAKKVFMPVAVRGVAVR